MRYSFACAESKTDDIQSLMDAKKQLKDGIEPKQSAKKPDGSKVMTVCGVMRSTIRI